MAFVVDLHNDRSVLEIFEVRRILEPAAAALAAIRISPEFVDRLENLLAEVHPETAVDDLVEHDLAFHQAIVDASGNDYFSGLVASMSSRTVRARLWRGITQRGATRRTIAEHRGILDALRRGDAPLASALTLAHIAGIEEWLRDASETDV